MKKVICFFICVCFMMHSVVVFAEGNTDLGLNAKSAILMEESTGNILYESNPDERLPIASVTKVMTMLLIMEAVDSGKISLDDMVTVSENAMSYGGSTMFLETGEQLTVNDMLKGIAVASANDGCVAMAEHLAGSESAFVDMMNEKAKKIGATNTHFVNCHGLHDDDHYTTAYDLYLIIKEFSKHDLAYVIDSLDTYDFTYTDADGNEQVVTIEPTNEFLTGEVNFPDGYSIGSWKTGTTEEALNCLIMELKNDSTGEEYIALVAGADGKEALYSAMTELINKAK